MEYKHFSHPHKLRAYYAQQGDNEYTCSGCELLISSGSSAYGCWECKYFLHQRCGNAERGIQHPSHAMHHLTLLPTTTYSTGSFLCEACGDSGTTFSYCCPLCEFDLHVKCASLPHILTHNSHLHTLYLTYDIKSFHSVTSNLRGICHKVLDNRFWAYSCFACNFHVHASCVSEEKKSVKAQKAEENVPETQVQGSASSQGPYQEEAEVEDPVLIAMQNLQLQRIMASGLSSMMSSSHLKY